jgi:hypothetical protein
MVTYLLSWDDQEIALSTGKLGVGSPCTIENQDALFNDLIQNKGQFKVNVELAKKCAFHAKQLLKVEDQDQAHFFEWWCSLLGVKMDDVLTSAEWQNQYKNFPHLSLEKKILFFASAQAKAAPLSFLFLGDFHFEKNQQIHLFNSLKSICDENNHTLVVFWSYRVLLNNITPLFFKGFVGDYAA